MKKIWHPYGMPEQLQKIKDLYIVGELLDIDGDTGGYNIQGAYSTGALAAESI